MTTTVGKGIANPIATIRSIGLLLENLPNRPASFSRITAAIEKVPDVFYFLFADICLLFLNKEVASL